MPPTASSTKPSAAVESSEDATNISLDSTDAAALHVLSSLATSISDRLSRDVHGNFYIQGAKTGKDNRHGQLVEIFALIKGLEEFGRTMDKYLNGVEGVVEAKYGKQIRDLKAMVDRLECERMGRDGNDEPTESAANGRMKGAKSAGVLKGRSGKAMSLDEIKKMQAKHAEAISALELWKESKERDDVLTHRDVRNLQVWRDYMKGDWKVSIDTWRWLTDRKLDAVDTDRLENDARTTKTAKEMAIISSWKTATQSWIESAKMRLTDSTNHQISTVNILSQLSLRVENIEAWRTWIMSSYNATLAKITLLFARRWY
ncbi:hypothetical protein LTR56_016288 [Elasticomyces elasticus]|nr:hypothetical protein LTR56_016288 [Elasticomyces elasticus]KAK3642850.1 hypothetical protein LTR22_015908 [Elasticomyces elasticus]KAK4920724.1 hypothetical protein LTR49_011800 [Elasticomyces elasticus]KAK5754138.1 hypothetical protein LTS12_015780 [Elasticomyces elasticus]